MAEDKGAYSLKTKALVKVYSRSSPKNLKSGTTPQLRCKFLCLVFLNLLAMQVFFAIDC